MTSAAPARFRALVAAMIVAPVVQSAFELVESLPETVRGAGGFGSTGTR